MADSLKEYKTFVIAHLRELEMVRAKNDAQKLKDLELIDDDDLLKKWLWIAAIVGSVVCFAILPLIMFTIAVVIPIFIMELFWTLLRFAMGVVIIICCLAIYFTTKKAP